MYNRNEYVDNFFKGILQEDETYNHYIYVMNIAPITKYLFIPYMAPLFNSHSIVGFTNKRILICHMGADGVLTGHMLQIDMKDVKEISIKKGWIKSKIFITFVDDSSIQFKPNNVCIGFSNHKKSLQALSEMYPQ